MEIGLGHDACIDRTQRGHALELPPKAFMGLLLLRNILRNTHDTGDLSLGIAQWESTIPYPALRPIRAQNAIVDIVAMIIPLLSSLLETKPVLSMNCLFPGGRIVIQALDGSPPDLFIGRTD